MCAPPPPFAAFPQYQGGSSFSVFTAQGSNPAVNCKISGKSVQKVYDKSVKGYVYSCSGGMSSKIQFPKDERTGLQLVQPYLVLQLFVPKGQHFSLELRATDTQSTRRKMYFSTSFSELKANPLHCQIPLSMIMRNTWISLALDVPDLFQSCFRVLSFRSLDVIILGPVCKLRKIFTMKSRLAQSVLEARDSEECLPLEHAFAAGVEATVQVIDTQKVQNLLAIASSVEGRRDTGAPGVFVARRKYPNKVDRHVNVAFGSRTPLPLSTVQINTNLPHDVNGIVGDDLQAPHLANITQRQTMSHTLKVSEPVPCPPQTRSSSAGTEKEPKVKALNPKAFNMLPQHMWDTASFPVQEEPHVDSLEMDPIVIEKCLDLTSKHGQKHQKMNRRRDAKVHKRYQVVRHSQKENCSQNKMREPKELFVNESPPGSPPSGWDNNSSGGSDSFLFEQHLEELPKSDKKVTLPYCYTFAHSFGDCSNHKEASQTSFQNECILGNGDSYFDKTISGSSKGGYPPLLYQNGLQDQFPVSNRSDNLNADEQKYLYDPRKCSLSDQGLGEQGKQTTDNHLCGNTDGTNNDSTKPGKNILTSRNLQEAGGMLEHKGAFGSTEEIWIVHEEGNFSDPSPPPFSNGTDENTSQLEGSSMTKSGFLQLSTRPFLSNTMGSSSTVAAMTGESSSLSVNSCPIEQAASSKVIDSSFYPVHKNTFKDDQINAENVLLKKPFSSKLEDKELDLLYDPILDCYYDPKTNRYYELK